MWEFIAFLLTALTFLLVGLAMSPGQLTAALPVIGAGYVAITVARVLVVYGLIGGGSRLVRREAPLPVGYLHVMFWAGLRGAVAVALALALPLVAARPGAADGRRVRGRADHAPGAGHDGRLGDPARRGDRRSRRR